MRKNLLKVACLTMGLSTLGLTGCNFNFSVGKEVPIASFELGNTKNDEAEVKEEIVDTDKKEVVDNNTGFGSISDGKDSLEDLEVVENVEIDDTNQNTEDKLNEIENEQDSNKADISGVHQFEYFKGEMPSYLTYHGISKDDSTNMIMSIFTKGDSKSDMSVASIAYMDLSGQGLSDYGITINFSDLSEDVMAEYLNTFGFSDMAPGQIKHEEYKKYNNLLFYTVDFEEESNYGTIGITIENNIVIYGIIASNVSTDESREIFDDIFNSVEFNYESVEPELNIEVDSASLYMTLNEDIESETKEVVQLNSDISTYSLNGSNIIINKTTIGELNNILGMKHSSVYESGDFVSYYYEKDMDSNDFSVITSKRDDSAVIESISFSYSDYVNNYFQCDSIPWGSDLDDVKNIYGEPDYVNEDGEDYSFYDWNLSDDITLSIMTENKIDGIGNNIVIEITVDYDKY